MLHNNPENTKLISKILRRPGACMALVFLCGLLFLSVFAEFIAPYHYDREDRTRPYEPPTTIHLRNEKGEWQFWPFAYEREAYLNDYHQILYREKTEKAYPLRFFVKGEAYRLWGIFSCDRHLFGIEAPASIHLFGTDSRGRDLFSRILMGGRISLSVGIFGVLFSLALGTLIGIFSGYTGGRVDETLMRLAEIFMMVPTFYLLLAIRGALPLGIPSLYVYFLIVYVLGLVGWAPLSRVIRGMVLSIKEREFVLAARLLGVSPWKIMMRHILPHTYSYLIVISAVALPGYLVAESALSLLGLGIQEPFVSWGMLLAEALSITQLKFHLWILIPAAFIFLAVFAFNVLGDELRDELDPHRSYSK